MLLVCNLVMIDLYRYVDVGCELFVIFLVWRVVIITLNPDDVKVCTYK